MSVGKNGIIPFIAGCLSGSTDTIMELMKNNGDLQSLVNQALTPLTPIPTNIESRLKPLPDVSTVLFDIYGTLLISGTGDIGIASPPIAGLGLEKLFDDSGFSLLFPDSGDRVLELLERFIKEEHQRLSDTGVDYPEVEIRDIWTKVLDKLWKDGFLMDDPADASTDELAIRYEMLVNPVWLMPGFVEISSSLSTSGYRTGIVSNAQFYTPIIIEALTGKPLSELGFDLDFCAWSYQLGRAKPSSEVFKGPLEQLFKKGISPENVLYVGNDMLNDVATASKAGCRTALFAGDSRSLRLRESDSRANVEPDIIITKLPELSTILKAR